MVVVVAAVPGAGKGGRLLGSLAVTGLLVCQVMDSVEGRLTALERHAFGWHVQHVQRGAHDVHGLLTAALTALVRAIRPVAAKACCTCHAVLLQLI